MHRYRKGHLIAEPFAISKNCKIRLPSNGIRHKLLQNPILFPPSGAPEVLYTGTSRDAMKMPVRAFGTFNFKVSDYVALIDKVAGVKQIYSVEDVRERVVAVLDQLLMKWISKEGKDMFNLQANAVDIANGIKQDLDMEITKIGIEITGFNIASFNYPEEIQKMQNKAASQSMVGDMNKYTQMAMADNLGKGGSNIAGDMMNVSMGMAIGNQMMKNMNDQAGGQMMSGGMNGSGAGNAALPKFCPQCGQPTNGARFCSNCGTKLM